MSFRPSRRGEARRVWRNHGPAVGTVLLATGIVAILVWMARGV